jgi:hypothetical protein
MRYGKGRLHGGRVWRRLGILSLGISVTGCAAVSQDVDAYYRQMAINYQEAIDKAKLDETSLENQSRVMLTTGDQSKYRKAQRELGHIRSWEEHCAWEKKRFEKAAKWMENHFDIPKKAADESSVPSGGREVARSDAGEATRDEDIAKTSTD